MCLCVEVGAQGEDLIVIPGFGCGRGNYQLIWRMLEEVEEILEGGG